MNFLAHAVLAERRRACAPFVLGSMLPDLAAIAGLRIAEVGDPELRAGVDFHHAGDDAFHGAPIFLEMMGEARDELEASGVTLGPAMAVSHVGLELLLDGWLVETGGATAYRRAMGEASVRIDTVRWTRPEGAARFASMRERLIAAPIPEGYVQPGFVADRLERILSRRPRLALQGEEAALVHRWAARAKPRMWARAEALLAEVGVRLATRAGD